MTPSPRTEPVLTATLLVPLIVWLAAYFGLDMDETTATYTAGAVLALGSLFARSKVRTRTTLPDPTAVKPPPSAKGLLRQRAARTKKP